MKTATEVWFEKLKEVWLQKDADAITGLMADEFQYFEDPFDFPITDKIILSSVWRGVKLQQIQILDITCLECNKKIGFARYHFKAEIAGHVHESKGACYVKLNTEGKAIEFRQWWNTKS